MLCKSNFQLLSCVYVKKKFILNWILVCHFFVKCILSCFLTKMWLRFWFSSLHIDKSEREWDIGSQVLWKIIRSSSKIMFCEQKSCMIGFLARCDWGPMSSIKMCKTQLSACKEFQYLYFNHMQSLMTSYHMWIYYM
jgi:hypothetical protein